LWLVSPWPPRAELFSGPAGLEKGTFGLGLPVSNRPVFGRGWPGREGRSVQPEKVEYYLRESLLPCVEEEASRRETEKTSHRTVKLVSILLISDDYMRLAARAAGSRKRFGKVPMIETSQFSTSPTICLVIRKVPEKCRDQTRPEIILIGPLFPKPNQKRRSIAISILKRPHHKYPNNPA
jgi:hypothetical protein